MKISLNFINPLLIGFTLALFMFSSCEQEEKVTPENAASSDKKGSLKSSVGDGTFYIINKGNGKALDLNTSNGNVQTYSYWGGNNQKWTLLSVGDGYYKISPLSNTSLALDIAGQSTANEANVTTYSYWGGANQQFSFEDVGNGYYKIIARNSGKVLDVVTSNRNVQQYSYSGGENQQWMLHFLYSSGSGPIKWILTTSNVPSDVKNRITAAMDAAVARYNKWGNWPARTLTVEYNTGVPTADGNINGNIRFGANSSYQTECTAMHEIAHTYGVGTSSKWGSPLIQNYKFVGTNAVAKIKEFDGDDATISTGGQHFWPYGLNYNSEWSSTNGDRHAQIVWAMVQDGL